MDRKVQHLEIQKEAHLLFEKKNKDYGDAFANYGPIGVIVRMGDKIQRLISIQKNGINNNFPNKQEKVLVCRFSPYLVMHTWCP